MIFKLSSRRKKLKRKKGKEISSYWFDMLTK